MCHQIDLTTPRATNEVVAEIAALPGPRRAPAVNAFLHSRAGQFERMASSMLRAARVRDLSLTGDVANILAVTAAKIIERTATGWRPANPSITFEVQVRTESRAQVRSLLDHELPSLSGSVGAQRRYREVQRTLAQLTADLGRTPSPEEVITATNVRLRATRKDPAREGILVTEADLVAPGSAPLSVDAVGFFEPVTTDGMHGDGLSALMDLLTSQELTRDILAACAQRSEAVGMVARVWLATVLDTDLDPAHRSVRTLMAAYAKVPRTDVPALLDQVLACAREVVLAAAASSETAHGAL